MKRSNWKSFEFLQGSRVPPHPQLHSEWESVMELYSDRNVAQPEVWYVRVVLARNEWDEVEVVDESVGMTAQKQCKDGSNSRYLKPCV